MPRAAARVVPRVRAQRRRHRRGALSQLDMVKTEDGAPNEAQEVENSVSNPVRFIGSEGTFPVRTEF